MVSRSPLKNKDEGFFNLVYVVARKIPQGRVTTYGAIARCIGSPGAARMVGWALNNCHSMDELIPAHRVVNRNGMLSGKHHFRHPDLMQELLESEGIRVVNDQVINFKEKYWEPSYNLI